MIGLLVILVVGGYLLVALLVTYFVVKLAGKRGALTRGKFIAGFFTLFVFWLIPFWDWIPTVVYHKHLCDTEAGAKIYRSVEGVEGYINGYYGDGYKYYDRYEGYGADRYIVRVRPSPKGTVPLEIVERITDPSSYAVKYEQVKLKLNAVKVMHTIYVTGTSEILATLTDFGYTAADPNVSMSEWRKPWLSGHSCFGNNGEDRKLLKKLILQTLKPVKSEK